MLPMCRVIDSRRVMVCDVSRDRVTAAVRERVGEAVRIETVHFEGTRYTCDDPARVIAFQAAVSDALGWPKGGFEADPAT